MSEPARSVADRPAARRRRFTVDALFQDTSPRAVGVRDLVTAKEIRLDRIEPDPHQPRRTFDQERLEELAASITREGVLQPIAVRYDADRDRYVIVHGERRWRAAQMAGLTAIPAIVRDVPEERRLLQQLMENVVREDLNAVDRAAALRALKAQMGDVSWERVAEAVGIKRSRLFQLLGTEKLPDAVREDIRAGRLSEKQSRVLQGLAPSAQAALARLIVDEGLGQAEAQRLARAIRDDPEFAAMEPPALLDRLRAMREVVERRPARAAGPSAVAAALARVLDEAAPTGDGAAYIRDAVERASAPAPDGDILVAQIQALALSLAQLADAGLAERERRTLAPRLRALRELIGAALDAHRAR
ncbi:MAG: ParB/RepB/Spo0J family partition protein [Sphaerobacter sp.]|nr:ParB/RepB/Spo0J family partition protein [Sphaerobacter sp.]